MLAILSWTTHSLATPWKKVNFTIGSHNFAHPLSRTFANWPAACSVPLLIQEGRQLQPVNIWQQLVAFNFVERRYRPWSRRQLWEQIAIVCQMRRPLSICTQRRDFPIKHYVLVITINGVGQVIQPRPPYLIWVRNKRLIELFILMKVRNEIIFLKQVEHANPIFKLFGHND